MHILVHRYSLDVGSPDSPYSRGDYLVYHLLYHIQLVIHSLEMVPDVMPLLIDFVSNVQWPMNLMLTQYVNYRVLYFFEHTHQRMNDHLFDDEEDWCIIWNI